ncbi:hypothetical protein ALO52_200100 [Pseudomonas syringae pv. primulae]|uniref:Chromosome partitioning protein ParA n=1 Tax=Pseudomonas syringae pv. primulae TaxID=251707 RepID=A0A0P9YE67_9PSED|nr:hypothetical protein ALO52_200100 [Pseudomonas syringae pv. primulae]
MKAWQSICTVWRSGLVGSPNEGVGWGVLHSERECPPHFSASTGLWEASLRLRRSAVARQTTNCRSALGLGGNPTIGSYNRNQRLTRCNRGQVRSYKKNALLQWFTGCLIRGGLPAMRFPKRQSSTELTHSPVSAEVEFIHFVMEADTSVSTLSFLRTKV